MDKITYMPKKMPDGLVQSTGETFHCALGVTAVRPKWQSSKMVFHAPKMGQVLATWEAALGVVLHHNGSLDVAEGDVIVDVATAVLGVPRLNAEEKN